MSLTGTTDTGWILRRWSNTDEYREVSEDGTEENTKTQKRTNSTFVIFKEVCGPTSFSSDNGTNVASPSGKLCGTTFTASGTWTVSDDDIEELALLVRSGSPIHVRN